MKLLRIESWQGWLFNFALGSVLFALPQIERFAFVLVAFGLITSAVFILNQIIDQKNDRENNLKKDLPIASGMVSKHAALMLFFSFTLIGLTIAYLMGLSIFLLLLLLLFLGIGYSTPPLSFKNRPIIDLIVCGIGSGVLPFLIGLQTASQLTLDFKYPWIVRRYQDALLTTIPLFLIQAAGQLFQVIGDHQADATAGINTFAVKFGEKNSLRLASRLIILTLSLPIIYELLNLSLTPYLNWYLATLVVALPFLFYVLNKLRSASEDTFKRLRQASNRMGGAILLLLLIYLVAVRFFFS
jgi:geranylgeranylglycerol-phosphate geranylgeranyltransferase